MKKILFILPLLLVLMTSCIKDWDEQNVNVQTDHAVLAPEGTFQITVLNDGNATFGPWEGDSLTCTTVSSTGLVTALPDSLLPSVAERDTDFIKVSIKGLRDKNVIVIVDPTLAPQPQE